jgi:hypothetical protein
MAEMISIREFARRVNVSDVAVLKAIRAGKIKEAIDYTNPKRPKINPELAAKEWGKNYDPSYHRSPNVSEEIKLAPTAKPAKAKAPAQAVVEPEAEATLPPGAGGRSLADIKRQTAEVKLRLSALDLKERQGELVKKDEVYRSLYELGVTIKEKLLSIPNRVTDEMRAAESRHEAQRILTAELEAVLLEYSKFKMR